MDAALRKTLLARPGPADRVIAALARALALPEITAADGRRGIARVDRDRSLLLVLRKATPPCHSSKACWPDEGIRRGARRLTRELRAGFTLGARTTDTLGDVANPDPSTLWVIRVPAVRTSIETLGKQKIHSAFMMYLYLRMKAREGKLAEASPSSDEMKSLIQMPGNPEKPYYVPMLDRGSRDAGLLPGFWRATNISGLWSARTLGRSSPLSWLTDGTGHYAMPADNADLALQNLLYGTRVSAAAMGAFFLRDQVFLKDEEPTVIDLIDTFRGRFGFPLTEDADFVKLFDAAAPGLPNPESWFELAPAEVVEVLVG